MTQQDFDQGWTVILAQPWGKLYRYDPENEATQRAFVKSQVDKFSPTAWQQACWFIASQWTAFPTTHDFVDQTSRIFRTLDAEAERQRHPLLDAGARSLPGDMPAAIREILDHVGKTGSFRQAFHEILPHHPDDEDAQRTLERSTALVRCGHGTPNCWHVPGLPCPSKPWSTLSEDQRRQRRLQRHELAKYPELFREYLDMMGTPIEAKALPPPANWTPASDHLADAIDDPD